MGQENIESIIIPEGKKRIEGGSVSSTTHTIHVYPAGSLPNLISESEKYNIEELTLTGELNGTDFRLIRDMAGCNYLGEETSGKLRVLDFSGAKIIAGGEKYVNTEKLPPAWFGSFRYTIKGRTRIFPWLISTDPHDCISKGIYLYVCLKCCTFAPYFIKV